eukprot:scaffold50268_cov30-Tisochrysis_lutea.AAC.5
MLHLLCHHLLGRRTTRLARLARVPPRHRYAHSVLWQPKTARRRVRLHTARLASSTLIATLSASLTQSLQLSLSLAIP